MKRNLYMLLLALAGLLANRSYAQSFAFFANAGNFPNDITIDGSGRVAPALRR